MKKPLASKIFGLAVLYCIVFCILVVLQFSNQGTFSLPSGGMTIRGRFADDSSAEETRSITGGIKVFYGGLEFTLKEERGKGLMLSNNGVNTAVNPEFINFTDNLARFTLPGGTIITFNSLDTVRGTELQISAEFAGNISEVIIPIIPRRSSLIQDSGQLGIMYSGSRYVFSSLGQELENGTIILSRDNSFISYRSRGRQRAFDPSDYVIAQEQNYANVMRSWQDSNFTQWNQQPSLLQTEDDIIAYLAQALQRGNFSAASLNVPRDFRNSQRHSHRSSGYVGGMSNAYRSFAATENEKMNQITRLIRARSLDILKEEHLLDYLFTRSNMVLANEVIELIINARPDMLISDYSPGLLEIFYDLRRWRPEANNPIEHLTDQLLINISENLSRDPEQDAVYASSSEGNISDYSARLGKALVYWAETTQNAEWTAIGRSLILSAVSTGSAGRLHNILKPSDYYPRAAWLTNSGHWAWTVSPNIRAVDAGSSINLAVTFPVNMTHHIIIRGVRPFLGIQIHGMAWRSDPQFEIYDSSGWIYYPEEQILILRLRHRSTIENVRLIYRYEEPAAPRVTEDAEGSVD
ncbi:MAG: hypothetical protein FWD28_09250 [Treponema sp.]|nr:hypothetical protein [Treponema sp.]